MGRAGLNLYRLSISAAPPTAGAGVARNYVVEKTENMAVKRIRTNYPSLISIFLRARLKFIALLFPALFVISNEKTCAQEPNSDVLRRGINIAHWFRDIPAGSSFGSPTYMSDFELDELRRVGFTFVRLPITPSEIQGHDGKLEPAKVQILIDEVRRLQTRGLGVVIVPVHEQWKLDSSEEDRQKLIAFWQQLAPSLGVLNSRLTFPEFVNEPNFRNPTDWADLQSKLLRLVRKALPATTVVLSGVGWSNIDGLRALTPVADRNVIYTVHYYEPPALTAEGNWDKTIDKQTMRQLPFPVGDPERCQALARGEKATIYVVRNYCDEGWRASTIHARIKEAADWGRANKAIVNVTEFGNLPADHDLSSKVAYAAAVRTAIEQEGLGWGLWAYDDSIGFNLPYKARSEEPRMDPRLLSALNLNSP
jgi:hypothetical protein